MSNMVVPGQGRVKQDRPLSAGLVPLPGDLERAMDTTDIDAGAKPELESDDGFIADDQGVVPGSITYVWQARISCSLPLSPQ
jgi:hypothetical protein